MNFAADEVESISFDATGTADTSAVLSNQTYRNNNPQTSSPRTNLPVSQTQTNQTANDAIRKPEPIKVNVKVLADNTSDGWTNSGWVVQKGQKIKITGSGRVSLGNARFTNPSGIASLPDAKKLMPNEATGSLIAVIGDDNNQFIYIGNSKEFIATRDGALFLGVNEGNLDDNSGAFDVQVEIDPSK